LKSVISLGPKIKTSSILDLRVADGALD
jgi:hypothetical protein